MIVLYIITGILVIINVAIRVMNKMNPPQAGDDYMGNVIQFISTSLVVVFGIITCATYLIP